MYKYEMDPASIMEDTKQTILSTDVQPDYWTDGRTDKLTWWKQYIPPFNLVEVGV